MIILFVWVAALVYNLSFLFEEDYPIKNLRFSGESASHHPLLDLMSSNGPLKFIFAYIKLLQNAICNASNSRATAVAPDA